MTVMVFTDFDAAWMSVTIFSGSRNLSRRGRIADPKNVTQVFLAGLVLFHCWILLASVAQGAYQSAQYDSTVAA